MAGGMSRMGGPGMASQYPFGFMGPMGGMAPAPYGAAPHSYVSGNGVHDTRSRGRCGDPRPMPAQGYCCLAHFDACLSVA
jgi:hypothetical protein